MIQVFPVQGFEFVTLTPVVGVEYSDEIEIDRIMKAMNTLDTQWTFPQKGSKNKRTISKPKGKKTPYANGHNGRDFMRIEEIVSSDIALPVYCHPSNIMSPLDIKELGDTVYPILIHKADTEKLYVDGRNVISGYECFYLTKISTHECVVDNRPVECHLRSFIILHDAKDSNNKDKLPINVYLTARREFKSKYDVCHPIPKGICNENVQWLKEDTNIDIEQTRSFKWWNSMMNSFFSVMPVERIRLIVENANRVAEMQAHNLLDSVDFRFI
jgi:hypothetical protein